MNIVGEYSIQYNIYTMFDVYTVKIKNHNLITDKGYEFFLSKWFKPEDNYTIQLGYYHENKFYKIKHVDDTYDDEVSYSKTINYVDRRTNKQYRFDGTKLVPFYEKLSKICLGNSFYTNNSTSKPLKTDTELYSSTPNDEYDIDNFELYPTKIVMICNMDNEKLNGTTEIGVKTNHGRLVSHDIHPPYNLPVESDMTLKYEFKLQK